MSSHPQKGESRYDLKLHGDKIQETKTKEIIIVYLGLNLNVISLHQTRILINNDLDKQTQAKTGDKRVRRFSDILAPLSRESKLNMRLQE